MKLDRRNFVKKSGLLLGGVGMLTSSSLAAESNKDEPMYKISLAEWSLHKMLFGGKMDHLDFAKVSKEDFGIDAVEYVNQFFKDKAEDSAYLAEMNSRADDLGVKNLLIMIDGEGALGDPDDAKRTKAVENHYKWVDAAKALGCHSIRVNAQSRGEYDEQINLAADGLRQLSEFAKGRDMNIIVENHGGLSSDGKWLTSVMKKVDLDNCGTLPDFGNFRVSRSEEYDRYVGVEELMPYAKAVSAKSYDFDAEGNDTRIDYLKMMKIVTDAGYHGYVGIEYEGSSLSEPKGILATKKLLAKVRDQLSQA